MLDLARELLSARSSYSTALADVTIARAQAYSQIGKSLPRNGIRQRVTRR